MLKIADFGRDFQQLKTDSNSMSQQMIHHEVLPNGLILVAQVMPWLQSAAFTLAFPSGCRFDPADRQGLSNFTCEMAFRGGGGYSSRELVEELEALGCDYYSSSGIYHSFFGGALPAENLYASLEMYVKSIGHADLPVDQLEDGRNVCIREIEGLDDDLVGRTMLALRSRYYGQPFGRNADGDMLGIQSINEQDIRDYYQNFYQPDGMIIAVAGQCDWQKLKAHVLKLTEHWAARATPMPNASGQQNGYHHIDHSSNQTHIGIAWPAAAFGSDEYYLNRAAIGVLSDGMSSRLFSEVREKRGLCYSVSASCHSIHNRGGVFAYSGTTTDSAQETLNVILAEARKLSEGIEPQELDRLKVQFRSNLIMQQESCRSRVSSLVSDVFYLNRIRTLDEINDRINALTVESVNAFLESNPPGPFDVVTLGEKALEVEREISHS
ncbi:MAG: pitrilysin family protein [Pirellulaceae bacterium]